MLKLIATHDNLTGLANRHLLQIEFSKAISYAQRHHTFIALLFLDLDNFKHINDTHGHSTGDELLVFCAKTLESLVRKTDILARIGGDEFVIAMTEITDPAHIDEIADKICSALANPIQLDDSTVRMTTSIGISIYPRDGSDLATLLKHADSALYKAKAAGRNTYVIYDPAEGNSTHSRLS
jgi:diguanylate cyclase (GGDEF)-like protein